MPRPYVSYPPTTVHESSKRDVSKDASKTLTELYSKFGFGLKRQAPNTDEPSSESDEKRMKVFDDDVREITSMTENRQRDAARAILKPKSPYICFSLANQYKIKEQLGAGATNNQVAKCVALTWKNMSCQERTYWHDAAKREEERERREAEECDTRVNVQDSELDGDSNPVTRSNVSRSISRISPAIKSISAKASDPHDSLSPLPRGQNRTQQGNKVPHALISQGKHVMGKDDKFNDDDQKIVGKVDRNETATKFNSTSDAERAFPTGSERGGRDELKLRNEAKGLIPKHEATRTADENDKSSVAKKEARRDAKDMKRREEGFEAKSQHAADRGKKIDSAAISDVGKKEKTAKPKPITPGEAEVIDMTADDDAPTITVNDNTRAYEVFQRKMLPLVIAEHPEMSEREVSKAIEYMWQDLPEADRSLYIQRVRESTLYSTHDTVVAHNVAQAPRLREASLRMLRNERLAAAAAASDLYGLPEYGHTNALGYVGTGSRFLTRLPPEYAAHAQIAGGAVPRTAVTLRPMMLDSRGLVPLTLEEEALMYGYQPQHSVRMIDPYEIDAALMERSLGGHRGRTM